MEKQEENLYQLAQPFTTQLIVELNRKLAQSENIRDPLGNHLPSKYFLNPLLSFIARLYYETVDTAELAEKEMTNGIQIGKQLWLES